MADGRRPHIVIVGGGFAGLDVARKLARERVSLTLVDRQNYHLFQPLLYQVATASLSPGDIASPIRWLLRHQANLRVLLAEVAGIDTQNHRIRLGPSSVECHHPPPFDVPLPENLSYDFLVLAAGATHAYFEHPEWADRAPGLKTLDDALEIRRRVLLAFEAAERVADEAARRRLLTFVIIGGGPTGVELAGALAEIARRTLRQDFRAIRPESSRVVLLEGGPDVLGVFPERLRSAARSSLERIGVEVHTESRVTRVSERGVTWRHEGSEHSIEAQTVLWAAGVAASPLAKALGVPLDRSGRVLVEPTLQVPGHPEIFAVGDLCAFQQDGVWLPGVAQVAKQEGMHVARNLRAAVRRRPLAPFRYRDLGQMATVGRGSAVADIGPLHVSGAIAWFLWLFIHILWLVGFRNRVAVFWEWAWAYLTFQRRVRLITGEGSSTTWPGEQSA